MVALDGGVVETTPDLPMERRLERIHRALAELIAWHEPKAMAIEDVYFGKNVQSATVVGQASGVAMLAAAQSGIGCFAYTPQAIKMAVCGSGAAGKGQVQRMVGTLLGLPEPPTPDHAADALAVAICHGGSHGHRQAVATVERRQAAARRSGWPDDRRGPRRGDGAASRPRRDRRRRRRLPAGGLGRDAEGRPRGRQRRLPARRADRPRGLARPLRLLLRGGARPLPAADLGQRHRPESRDRDPLRRQPARAPAGDRRRRRQTLPGGAGDRQTDRGADHRRAAREGHRDAGGGGRAGRRGERATPARSPATASSTSATRRSRPSSCSTGSSGEDPEELVAGALRKAGAAR